MKCQYKHCDNDIPEDRIERGERYKYEAKYCSKRCSKLQRNYRHRTRGWGNCIKCGKRLGSYRAKYCKLCIEPEQVGSINFEEHLKDPESLFQSCEVIRKIMKDD